MGVCPNCGCSLNWHKPCIPHPMVPIWPFLNNSERETNRDLLFRQDAGLLQAMKERGLLGLDYEAKMRDDGIQYVETTRKKV